MIVSSIESQTRSKKYVNYEIPSSVKSDKYGSVSLVFDINKPITTKIFIGDKTIWLLIEPSDTINVSIGLPNGGYNTLGITGKNSSGNKFYNLIYNRNFLDKFYGINLIFEKYADSSIDTIFQKITTEVNNQISWIDSLFLEKKVTQTYVGYMKTEIKGLLAWEVGNKCEKYYGTTNATSLNTNKGHLIKERLFKLIDPFDPKLETCVWGNAYYDTYFTEVANANFNPTDSVVNVDSTIIIDELKYIALAPPSLREYLWGKSVVIYTQIATDRYDPCTLYKKYKSMYKSNEYIDHLDTINICKNVSKKSKTLFLKSTNQTFFDLVFSELNGKRMYIDFWATWCLPCKIEFKSYDANFFDVLKMYHVETVFISVDEKDHKKIWQRTVEKSNLKGYHILADEKLKISIRDIVYGGKNKPIIIPRYIIVNESGQILTVSAKRPSESLLRQDLKKFFEKK